MRYIIIYDNKPFYTSWYDFENNYADGMMVIDQAKTMYTTDGKTWLDMEEDHL